jgi:hypothetical protein
MIDDDHNQTHKNHPKFEVDLLKEARQDLHYQSMVEELLGLKDDVGA